MVTKRPNIKNKKFLFFNTLNIVKTSIHLTKRFIFLLRLPFLHLTVPKDLQELEDLLLFEQSEIPKIYE
ncbi:hypothetical protein B4125_0853 [Bacillus paralicheniformis]|nr:hypothetical protein SC10_B2orf02017 [Bacillus paralicheniformis]OLG06672.1 hypothetical protein B4125_0853 [Bacillus paralicheniformis]TWM01543.1 hypothetical protein CHCC15136_3211 [Bacillus paralicheniformis]TWM41882.1 hypothetical protein CHCC14817_2912 [Bacillus paralicheniformis]TWN37299.1 hypothetical protein CHCC14523_4116 [Bacillus paralicheniformis]